MKIIALIALITFAVSGASAQTSSRSKQPQRRAGVIRVGPATTYLKEGLTTEEVLRLLGEPSTIFTSMKYGETVKTYEFRRSAERVLVAEFVSDSLVSYRVENRGQVARANATATVSLVN